MGDGSDIATFNSVADISKLTVLDGGDDVSSADGWIDTLNLNLALTGSSSSAGVAGDTKIINWEAINVGAGGALNLSGDLGAEQTNIASGGVLSLVASTINSTMSGNVSNSGTISLVNNPTPSQVLTIAGDYTGNNGSITMNTMWNAPGGANGENSESDKLIITGHASGQTTVSYAEETVQLNLVN